MAIQRYTVRRTGDEDTDRNLDEIARSISSLVDAVSGSTALVNLQLVTLDFGTGATEASTLVRASWAKASSVILAGLADDSRLDDALMEGISIGVTGRGPGVFTVSAMAPAPVAGQYVVAVAGA